MVAEGREVLRRARSSSASIVLAGVDKFPLSQLSEIIQGGLASTTSSVPDLTPGRYIIKCPL